MGNFFADATEWYKTHKLVRVLTATAFTYFFVKYCIWLVLPFLLSILFLNCTYPMIERLSFHKKGLRSLVTGVILFFIGCIPIGLLIIMYQAGVHCVSACVQQLSIFRECAQGMLTRCCCYLQSPLGISSEQLEKQLLGFGQEMGGRLSELLIPVMTSGGVLLLSASDYCGGIVGGVLSVQHPACEGL